MSIGAAVLVPITLILNYLFTPRFGMFGTAFARLAVYSGVLFGSIILRGASIGSAYGWSEMAKQYAILGAARCAGIRQL
jgi:hypothetical protein